MRYIPLLATAIAAMVAAPASALTFGFSFINSNLDGALVTGAVDGLEDDVTGAATSVLINSDSFGDGEYVSVGSTLPNVFTVANGEITNFAFASFGSGNQPPAVICCSLAFNNSGDPDDPFAGLSNTPAAFIPVQAFDFAFTPVDSPAPVPAPAPLLLLASALAALAALARRRPPRAAPEPMRLTA